ncbi:unnamed protein product [Caenorhabditis sp. 36 PRJEB53466]|nr:unnamed protein product [Caenorhabditis sp. 36 PRJEB53466]
MLPSLSSAAKWIVRNTIVSNESLTPELRLHLITVASPLWMSTPDACPLHDPYWAFYWPGGQGLSRYILDNSALFRGSKVLDFGAGCGSASMAAQICGARAILANDIDKYALVSTKLNFRLNGMNDSKVRYSASNFLQNSQESSDFFRENSQKTGKFVLLGDMFYDSDFAEILFAWLKKMRNEHEVRVLVGDPDRHPLAESEYLKRYRTRFTKEHVAEYGLPGYVIKEHYGFNTAKCALQNEPEFPLTENPVLHAENTTSAFKNVDKRSASSDYDVFVNDITALTRILNAISLDSQLREGSVDVVEVALELAVVGRIPKTLMDELMDWSETEWKQLHAHIETFGARLDAFGTANAATWNDSTIQNGLRVLEGLVDKVRSFAVKLDEPKVKELLDMISELGLKNLTMFNGNPPGDLLKSLKTIDMLTDDPMSSIFKDAKLNIQRVLSTMNVLEKSQSFMTKITIFMSDNTNVLDPLLRIVASLNESASEFGALTGLAHHLGTFVHQRVSLRDLLSTLNSSSPRIATLKKYVDASSAHSIANYTLGFVNGLADLEAVGGDLKSSRIRKLLSGGLEMTALEESIKWIDTLKVEMKKVIGQQTEMLFLSASRERQI